MTTDTQTHEKEAERAVADLIETYRQGFLHLDPEQIASIWDARHEPLIYVAQEMKEPTYGWPAIQRYMAALPEHLDKVLAKEVKDLKIDVLGDTAVAFFISHSRVKLKARAEMYEPTFRVSMIFQRAPAGWRAIHFHESSLSAQAVQAMTTNDAKSAVAPAVPGWGPRAGSPANTFDGDKSHD